jgi:sugar lactone lactonase YvrE
LGWESGWWLLQSSIPHFDARKSVDTQTDARHDLEASFELRSEPRKSLDFPFLFAFPFLPTEYSMKTLCALALCLLVLCSVAANTQSTTAPTDSSLAASVSSEARGSVVSASQADGAGLTRRIVTPEGPLDPRQRDFRTRVWLRDHRETVQQRAESEFATKSKTTTESTGSSTQIVTTAAGLTRSAYGNGGAATSAYLNVPRGVAVDAPGNLYIADGNNFQIRKVNATTRVISAFAGTGQNGYTNDGQLGVNAQLSYLGNSAVDSAGNIYIADSGNNVIREVNAVTGLIITIAGNGTAGSSGDGGPAILANLYYPSGVAVDSAGNLYIADTDNSVIREVTRATGVISTVAGMFNSDEGYSGDGGPATKASLLFPQGVAVDASGDLYIADTDNNVIRFVSAATGIIGTYAGKYGTFGYSGDGGPATDAEFESPQGINLDSSGNLYIADGDNFVIRKVTASTGIIETVAGNGTSGFSGDGGAATQAELGFADDVAVDASGNLYIADEQNNRIRRVDTKGIITTVAGNGLTNPLDNGAAAVSAPITTEFPEALTTDAKGNIYFADGVGNAIREVSAADGTISTIAGTGQSGYTGDGGLAVSAQLSYPNGLALDSSGNVYIADSNNYVVRRLDRSTGIISTFAGNGSEGTTGDGGPATSAGIVYPGAIALDSSGNVYIAETYSSVVRKVNPQGIISTAAGNGTFSCCGEPNGDGGPATSASLGFPYALAVDAQGNLYIGDGLNPVIREVNASTGIINTVVGNGTYGDSGDGGPALSASINDVYGLAFDPLGNLYLADEVTIRVVTSGIIETVAGRGDYTLLGYFGDGGPVASAGVTTTGVAVDSFFNVYFGDGVGNRIRKIWTSAPQAAAATPVSTPAGGNYGSMQTVTLSDSTPGTQIFFTLDGSTPNPGTSSLYTGPLSLIGKVTVTAIAIAPGYSTSASASESYTFPAPAATTPAYAPIITPVGGNYFAAQTVTMTDATPGAMIYYTTDGSTPTTSSTQYSAAITVSATETVNAIAAASGYTNSAVTTAVFSITSPTTTTVTSSENPATPGGNLTFTATVTSMAAGVPTGTVNFSVDGGAAVAEPLNGIGNAAYSTATPALGQHTVVANYSGDAHFAASSGTLAQIVTAGLQFVPMTPCRVADTRNPAGPFGGPELAPQTSREFDIPQSACGVPATAVAYSLNVTAVPNAVLTYLTLWPSGQPQPNVSTLNSDGRYKANAAITPAGTSGGVSVFVSDASQVILDIDGYFVPAGTASSLAFYPVTPCRIADTRGATSPLGGPFLAGGSSRSFPVQSSSCGLPANAQAYSLNVTAVPHTPLIYLPTWPSGETQPNVSTLNAPTGAITANAAIVPAGSSGAVSIYVSDDSDVILDVNGYFAPPAPGGLSLYTTTPCRALDTRPKGFAGRVSYPVQGSVCAPPSTAQAYVLNATVVPPGPLLYLTLWPDPESQPNVSTLNAFDGAVTSNMAIVPSIDGSIDAFSSNPTNLILDLSSYFAP